MSAAFVVAFRIAGLRKYRSRDPNVFGLAIVGRTGKRQLLGGEAVGVGGAALDHRQALEGLDRRARKNGEVDVAGGHDDLAIAVDDRISAGVAALDRAASRDLNENWIDHSEYHSRGS